VTKDQAALVSDQAKASAAQQQEAADLSQAEAVCAASSSSVPTSTPTTSTTTNTTAPTSNDSACTTALEQVSSDQQQVSGDQSSVATDETNLAKALSAEPSSSGSTGSSGTPSSATTSVPSTSGGTGSSEQSGTTGTEGSASSASDSAEQIASDEASIDTAQADLIQAQQSLDDAQLSSPVSGTVASIAIGAGDTVSAGSSTSAIVIIGTQSYEVTGTLSSTQVASVKDGDSAQVSVDGDAGTITGTVAQLGPVQSSSSGYTYPVVIALPATAEGLHSGSTANVSITTGEAKNVLAVPTSAVMTQDTTSYVLVLSSGGTKQKDVKVGIVGDIYTQVLSGLQKGNEVVLADDAEAVPSSNTTTVGGLGGTGGFAGAAGGAGFRGGGSTGGTGVGGLGAG
jgi:multidrug efflux pump subunit AcrA (membrane-fusion protein)